MAVETGSRTITGTPGFRGNSVGNPALQNPVRFGRTVPRMIVKSTQYASLDALPREQGLLAPYRFSY
jgi:hypothetical protein